MFIHNSWASSLTLATSYKSLHICAFCRLCFQVKNEQRCTLLKVLSFGSSSFFCCPLGSPKTEAVVLQLCRIPAYHAVSSVNLSPKCFFPKLTGHKKNSPWGHRWKLREKKQYSRNRYYEIWFIDSWNLLVSSGLAWAWSLTYPSHLMLEWSFTHLNSWLREGGCSEGTLSASTHYPC